MSWILLSLLLVSPWGVPPRHVAGCYLPPIDAPVVEEFVAPSCPYCAGQRGREYAPASGATVRAVEAGVVTFAGLVAGTRYVVVRHADGVRATYGMLLRADVAAGDRIAASTPIGTSTVRLYFGLRDPNDVPLDPREHLAMVTRRARLVPVDGSPARPAAQRSSCPGPVPRGGSPR